MNFKDLFMQTAAELGGHLEKRKRISSWFRGQPSDYCVGDVLCFSIRSVIEQDQPAFGPILVQWLILDLPTSSSAILAPCVVGGSERDLFGELGIGFFTPETFTESAHCEPTRLLLAGSNGLVHVHPHLLRLAKERTNRLPSDVCSEVRMTLNHRPRKFFGKEFSGAGHLFLEKEVSRCCDALKCFFANARDTLREFCPEASLIFDQAGAAKTDKALRLRGGQLPEEDE